MRNQSPAIVVPIDDTPGSEKSPPRRADDEDDEDWVASFSRALTASVAGPMWEKVLYYIVLLVAVGFFAYNSIDVLHRWATETVTTIKIIPAGSVVMPTAMVAIPSVGSWGDAFKTPVARPECPLSRYGNCADLAFKDVAWATTIANGSNCLTCWYSMNGAFNKTTSGSFNGTFPSKDRALHQSLLALVGKTNYTAGEEFVIYTLNSAGGILSTPTKQVMLTNKFKFDFGKANKQKSQGTYSSQIYIGLLDPGVSTFAGGQLWIGGAFNKINTLKITVEKTIDETKGGAVTYAYQGTLSEIAMEKNIKLKTEQKQVDTEVRFEMGSFSVRQITIRHMSFSEVYSGIGGCWAAAALIVGIFFNEKVGGTRGKVQVFRFKGPKGRKALAQLAAKQLGTLLMDKAKEECAEAIEDVPGEMPGEINGANVKIPGEGTGEAPGSIQEGQNELLATLASKAGPKALKFAIARLRPKLEPKLKQNGLTWEDILPILQSFDTPDELLEAFEDPEAFFQSLAKKGGPLGIKIAIMLLRPKLEPKLEKQGLKWADIVPILELVDTPEELSAAIENPEAFLESLAKKSGPLGIKLTIILLRPKIEPKLKEKGRKWEDVLPLLELVDTPDELSAAAVNPELFLEKMASQGFSLPGSSSS